MTTQSHCIIIVFQKSSNTTRSRLTASSHPLFLSPPHTMNMQSFGTVISGNRRLNSELPDEARAAIMYGLENKQSPSQLEREFNIHRSTIYRTQQRFTRKEILSSRPRTSRPEKLSPYSKRYIYRIVRKSPRLSWMSRVSMAPNGVSKSTIRRVRKEYNLKKWQSKKRM